MMENIDELLKRANKFKFDYATRHGTALLDELAASLRAQQAEIERLKGEYARGIENAAKWHDKEIVEITSQLDRGIANSDGEIQMVLERIFHKRVATEIRALIKKEGE